MLKNKHILITQPAIRSINGSTVVALELAQELSRQGAKVSIYTCDYADPAKTLFEKQGFKIDEAKNNPDYKLSDFDYIWVHSQIVPISIVEQLSQKLPKKIPAFIFLHMSGMDWIPDEKPWIYDLENRLSSLSLFICEEVENINKTMLDPKIPTNYFRNPAPANYKSRFKKPNDNLEKILIVSSHPPKEILEAKEILQSKHHIHVDSLGEGQEKYELFNKDLLEQYDAIITIAKTVPYCLVSGTPVYVYDAFGGGPGWLNKDNFKKAKERNFSGYQNNKYPNYVGGVFDYKTAKQIITEILGGYNKSLDFHTQYLNNFNSDFAIDSVLPQIFNNLKPRNIGKFPTDYVEAVKAAQLFASSKFEAGGIIYERDKIVQPLKQKNEQLLLENLQLLNYKQNADAVFDSRSFKLFDKIIQPYKKLKSIKKEDK